MRDTTDAQILYALARNQVYGELSRAMESFCHNSHGLLAQERKKMIPQFNNDALFYRETIFANNYLNGLQEFCEARRDGVDYYTARRKLMDIFEPFIDKPFNDDDYVFFPPSYMDPMHETTEAEKEAAYRWRHIDEFRTTVHVLDTHFRQSGLNSWGTEAVFKQMHNRLNAFMDPAAAAQGFDKFPAPAEVVYFNDAVKWLKERAVMSEARADVNIIMDTTGLPGIFGKVTGNTLPEKLKYAHYSQHCEKIAEIIEGVVIDGSYLAMLRVACPLQKVNGRDIIGNYATTVAVNQRQVLAELAKSYLGAVIDNHPEPTDKAKELYMRDLIEGCDAAVADFFDEFVFNEKRKPEPVHKPLVFHDLKF